MSAVVLSTAYLKLQQRLQRSFNQSDCLSMFMGDSLAYRLPTTSSGLGIVTLNLLFDFPILSFSVV